MLGYGYGVSQYLQFYVKDLDMYQALPRPNLEYFDGGTGEKLIKNKWVLYLASQAEICFWEYIEYKITSNDIKKGKRGQYWKTLKKIEKSKEILPSKCIIGKTIFTSMAVIGGRVFSNHPINLNHLHKDSKYLVSVIITLGENISGGDTVFYDGVKTSDLGIRSHVLKNLHGRMIFCPFDFFP